MTLPNKIALATFILSVLVCTSTLIRGGATASERLTQLDHKVVTLIESGKRNEERLTSVERDSAVNLVSTARVYEVLDRLDVTLSEISKTMSSVGTEVKSHEKRLDRLEDN